MTHNLIPTSADYCALPGGYVTLKDRCCCYGIRYLKNVLPGMCRESLLFPLSQRILFVPRQMYHMCPKCCYIRTPNVISFYASTYDFIGAWGSVVVKALLVGRTRDRFPVVSLDFSVTYSFRPYHGPGVDSAPSENEYQEHFRGVKAAGAWGWRPHHLHVSNVIKSGSLNLLEPSGPHRACYGTPLPFYLLRIILLPLFAC